MSAPDPMTPPECDLRGYEYMPLFGGKLFGSTLYTDCTDAEFRTALKLWWSAWQQCPAGSLPASDGALALLADYGRDLKGWGKVRNMALRGFVLCSDGRLYHPMLCEAAVKAYELRLRSDRKRETDRKRLQAWRDKQDKTTSSDRGNVCGNADETGDETRFDTVNETRVETSNVGGRREGKIESKEDTGPTGPDAEAASPPNAATLLWREGIPILQALTGKSDGQCRGLLGKLRQGVDDDCPKLLMILQQARDMRPTDPVAWITAATQNRERQQYQRRQTPSEAVTAAFGPSLFANRFDLDAQFDTPVPESGHVRIRH